MKKVREGHYHIAQTSSAGERAVECRMKISASIKILKNCKQILGTLPDFNLKIIFHLVLNQQPLPLSQLSLAH